jgi:hypothetical protein
MTIITTNLDGTTTTQIVADFAAPTITYNKLKIVRALEALGLGDAFEQAIQSTGPLRRAWVAAAEVSSDDPLLLQAIPDFAAALGITPEQIAAMLREAVAE